MAAEKAPEKTTAEKRAPEEEAAKAADDAGKESEETRGTVTLTNRTRRPVHARVGPGRTIRLGPGQTSEALGEQCAQASEVRALCGKGVLAVAAVSHGPQEAASKPRKQKPKKPSQRGLGAGRKPPEPGGPEAPEHP